MSPSSVYSRAVRKAAEMLGGRDKLARTLQVPVAEIEKWILGEKKPPREIFLRVVDLLIEDPAGSDDSPGDPPSGPQSSHEAAGGESCAAMFD